MGENRFISFKINQYMLNGLQGMIQNYIAYLNKESGEEMTSKKINTIINDDLMLVSNVFRFELPRFLGLIERLNKLVHEIIHTKSRTASIKSLIELLEYDAETREGKIVFDYGAPQNVIKKFDGKEVELDEYEVSIHKKIQSILF
jgi:hypothetical protein